ncbi:MAG: DUF512 domain-containing protein, partial [Candidatus Muiribacteriota bacterium]
TKKAGKILSQLKFLTDNQISLHTQIVLCPGLNDGKELLFTLEKLYSFTPFIDSVGIVPVGLTSYRKNLFNLSLIEKNNSDEVFEIIKFFQKKAMNEYGVKWVYPADEFFYKSRKEIPGKSFYDSFVQIENGIGLSRKFIDSFTRAFKKSDVKADRKGYIITSALSAELIGRINDKFNLKTEIIKVENNFFGKSVTVAGLLTANDILKTIKKECSKNNVILIPDVIFNNDNLTLDGMTAQELLKTDERINIIGSKGYDYARFFRG